MIIVVSQKSDSIVFTSRVLQLTKTGTYRDILEIPSIDWVFRNALHARWNSTGQRVSHLWQAAVSLVMSTHFWSFPSWSSAYSRETKHDFWLRYLTKKENTKTIEIDWWYFMQRISNPYTQSVFRGVFAREKSSKVMVGSQSHDITITVFYS